MLISSFCKTVGIIKQDNKLCRYAITVQPTELFKSTIEIDTKYSSLSVNYLQLNAFTHTNILYFIRHRLYDFLTRILHFFQDFHVRDAALSLVDLSMNL